jgi:hypothetical protein
MYNKPARESGHYPLVIIRNIELFILNNKKYIKLYKTSKKKFLVIKLFLTKKNIKLKKTIKKIFGLKKIN